MDVIEYHQLADYQHYYSLNIFLCSTKQTVLEFWVNYSFKAVEEAAQ